MSSLKLCDEVLIALRRITRAIDLHSRKLMQTAGITGPQLLVLQVLDRHGAMTVGRLAKLVNLSQGTITSILDRLERRELVIRARSEEDRRRVLACLSEAGHTTLARAPTPLQQDFVDAFEGLETWEQLQILAAVERLATMMKAETLPAEPILDSDSLAQSPTDQGESSGKKQASRRPLDTSSGGRSD